MKQFIVTTIFNDLSNQEAFKKTLEEFKQRLREVKVGDVKDPTSLSIAVKNDGVGEIL